MRYRVSVDEGYPSVVNVTERRSPRYVAVLAMAAGLILAAGWLLRPRDVPQSPPPVVSESELQELSRRAQRRSLESTTAYFADLATTVRSSLGYIPSMGMAALVLDDSHVITGPIPISDRPAALTLQTAAGERTVEAASSRRLPLSVLEIDVGPPARMARRAASPPQTGDWVVAVGQSDHAPAFAAANFRQIASTTCGIAQVNELTVSIPLTRAMTGGGIFNMDGELLAVILPCGDRIAAIELRSIDQMVARLMTVDERLLALYGILFTRFSTVDRQYFSDTDGVLVREVWMGTRGEAAGLQPGDVVVGLNDRAVGGIDDLRSLTIPSGDAFALRIRRGTNSETVMLEPTAGMARESSESDAHLGLVIGSPATAFRISEVPPQSRAARAGVKAGDVLRRINRIEPRTRGQAERAVKSAASKPMLLEIERDRRRLAIVIPGAPAR